MEKVPRSIRHLIETKEESKRFRFGYGGVLSSTKVFCLWLSCVPNARLGCLIGKDVMEALGTVIDFKDRRHGLEESFVRFAMFALCRVSLVSEHVLHHHGVPAAASARASEPVRENAPTAPVAAAASKHRKMAAYARALWWGLLLWLPSSPEVRFLGPSPRLPACGGGRRTPGCSVEPFLGDGCRGRPTASSLGPATAR